MLNPAYVSVRYCKIIFGPSVTHIHVLVAELANSSSEKRLTPKQTAERLIR